MARPHPMASTAEARRLTEGHRLAQNRLGAQTVAQMLTAWLLLDPADIDGTVEAWLRIAVPAVRGQHAASANLAAAYVRRFRTLENVPGRPPAVPRSVLPAEQTVTSLTVTGPATVKAATARGVPTAQAAALGATGSSRSAMRLALDGGRQMILDTVRADPQAEGWARATSGNPCHFCAMLASRGPAYSEASVDFEAHDGCGCFAEPVYDRDADWPAGSREYQDLWQQAKADDGDTAKNFRRLVESR